jgi:predicted dehydrogenase
MSNHHSNQLTRRKFLTPAANAVATPCLIPASALGRGGTVAPSERIVMGGIGLGGRGSYDMGVMLAHKDVHWVAVCDVVKERRAAAKDSVDAAYANKDCAVYSDMRQLLAERTDVDAVLIATGDRWHALASVWAMQAGKDVFCEKPSCLTMAEGPLGLDNLSRRRGDVQRGGGCRH